MSDAKLNSVPKRTVTDYLVLLNSIAIIGKIGKMLKPRCTRMAVLGPSQFCRLLRTFADTLSFANLGRPYDPPRISRKSHEGEKKKPILTYIAYIICIYDNIRQYTSKGSFLSVDATLQRIDLPVQNHVVLLQCVDL